MASKRAGDLQQGIELTRILRLAESQKQLEGLVKTPGTRPNLRNAALDALVAIDAGKHAATCGDVLADAALPVEAREHAARLLAQANQSKLLLAALPTAPARLQNSIAAGLAGSLDGGEALLQAVAAGKASARLLQEPAVVFRLAAVKTPMLKERLAKLTAGLPAADAKLAQLIAARRKGYLAAKPDVAKGVAVFEKVCANCHQVGGKGAKVGPQLDGIGLRGLDRLLEDTLDPNRNVDEAFRTTRLVLTSGKSVEGLFLREEGAVLVLADQQGKEVRVPKKEVEERSLSPLSPMPANLHEQIAEGEFSHLLAYLLSLKPTKP
ncbi:MAG: c-type cytochrome [Gemmataceae bacterium]